MSLGMTFKLKIKVVLMLLRCRRGERLGPAGRRCGSGSRELSRPAEQFYLG